MSDTTSTPAEPRRTVKRRQPSAAGVMPMNKQEKLEEYYAVLHKITEGLNKLNRDGYPDTLVLSVLAGLLTTTMIRIGFSRDDFLATMTTTFDAANDVSDDAADGDDADIEGATFGKSAWKQ